jgi:surface-anchored protein
MKPNVKKPSIVLAWLMVLATAPGLAAQCRTFTQEHVDLLAIQYNAASNTLSLMASDDDHGGVLYASNECVVVCPESMKFTLPDGTPLGQAGDPLWILPQNPYPGVPYVGVSAEALAPGSFNDPLTIRLVRLEGPGDFIVWQATGFGSFDLKMDTRDGIGPNDQFTPFVGGHEHHNWGFTTSGVYRAYFQASGRRPGESTNLVSPETPFTFHVLPLRPFEHWTATHWPCEGDLTIIAPDADPDRDTGVNAIEYALGTDPRVATTNGWPTASLVRTNGQVYGALTYTRVKAATDCRYEVIGATGVSLSPHQIINTVHSVVDHASTERVTLRDMVPLAVDSQRFYQLRVTLD